MGQGAVRLSASDLREEIEAVQKEIQSEWIQRRTSSRNYLIDQVSDEMADFMQDVRLGKKEI
jgi:predicted RNA-binding protein with PIN domain